MFIPIIQCAVAPSCLCESLQEPPFPPELGSQFIPHGLSCTGQGLTGEESHTTVVTQAPFPKWFCLELVMGELG